MNRVYYRLPILTTDIILYIKPKCIVNNREWVSLMVTIETDEWMVYFLLLKKKKSVMLLILISFRTLQALFVTEILTPLCHFFLYWTLKWRPLGRTSFCRYPLLMSPVSMLVLVLRALTTLWLVAGVVTPRWANRTMTIRFSLFYTHLRNLQNAPYYQVP